MPQAGAGTILDDAGAPTPADRIRGRAPVLYSAEAINAINQKIFQHSLDLILVVDSRGNFLRVSPSAREILGYDPIELVGRCSAEILYPEDLDSTRDEMRLARHTGLTRNFECRYVHKGGDIVVLWWIGIWSEAEHQYFFIGRDITERKRAERLERESTARLALAVEMGGIGLASADSPVAPAEPNARFNAIYGWPADKQGVSAGEWLRLIHPDDRDRVAADVLEVIKTGGVYRGEFRIRRADTNEERWVRAATQTVREADGGFGRFLGVHIDITDLKESAHLLEAAIGAAQLGTWASDMTAGYDADSRLEWSPETLKICGFTEETFDHRVGTFWDMIHPGDQERVAEARRNALDVNEPYHAEFRIIRPDGVTRWVHLRAGIIRNAGGAATKMTGVLQDTTDLHLLDERLQQAQRMDAIGQLTGGMAHDFNNLLGIVIANLDLLRLDSPLDATQQELVDEAIGASMRGADLTRRLLAFARRQQLQPERIEVNELVASTVTLLTRTLGERIPIRKHLADGVWPIMVDPAQLESALVNLATNARDAMPRGGELTVATGNRVLDAEYAAGQSELVAGEYVMIEVSDTGTGIPPDVMARVFEPFFTTKDPGKGTGLGLAMVFGFAKQSGGHINVYSEVGKGTTFRLYLPRDSSGEVAAVRAEVAPAATGGNETILVVEDNEGIRRVVRRQLLRLGYRVVETDNAASALEFLATEPIVLLFTDVVMPGDMDGVELALAAMERWPALKVILTSGFPESRLNGNGDPIAGLRLLSKPYRGEDLARALREVLDSGQSPAS